MLWWTAAAQWQGPWAEAASRAHGDTSLALTASRMGSAWECLGLRPVVVEVTCRDDDRRMMTWLLAG